MLLVKARNNLRCKILWDLLKVCKAVHTEPMWDAVSCMTYSYKARVVEQLIWLGCLKLQSQSRTKQLSSIYKIEEIAG